MISREKAIAYFKRHLELYCVDGISREAEEMAIKALEKQKTGHWMRTADKSEHFIWECDKCEWQQRFATKYCPDCVATMETII